MIIGLLTSALLLLVGFIWYRYYYYPKKEIRRYKTIFQNLGYSVYEDRFAFLGVGFIKELRRCEKMYKDAYYTQKTLYPQFDIVLNNTLDTVNIVVINPDLLKDFLSADATTKYEKVNLLTQGAKFLFGQGIIFSEGQKWKNKRKIVSKIFNFELIKENIPKISEICDRWINHFEDMYKLPNGEVRYNTMNLSARIFSSVMIRCFFGTDEIKQKVRGQCFQEFILRVVERTGELTNNPIQILFGKFAYKHGITSRIRNAKIDVAILRRIISEMSQKRAQQVAKAGKIERFTDLIEALHHEKTSVDSQSYQYSDQELLDQFSTFIIAGTDTTSHFFTMMMFYVAKYPSIQKRLRDQISEFIHSKEDITFENLKKLTYIDWIQFETTRYYGPANGQFPRIAIEDHYLWKVPIKKGICIGTQPLGNHYNPKIYKDPFAFRPERWERQCDNLHPYALVGFGGGPRTCIGKQLAHLETKIALVKLVMKYANFSLQKNQLFMSYKFLYEPEPHQIIFSTKVAE